MTPLRATLELALQHHQAGRLPQAEALYREILQSHPGQPDALNLLGVLANQAGQPEVAIDLITQALAQLPGEADFHGNLAAAYQLAGRVPDAVRHFREAIRLKPTAVNQHVFLSEALQQLGQMDEARFHAHEAVRLDPDSALAFNNLGDLAGHSNSTLTETEIQHLQNLLTVPGHSAQDASLLCFTLAAHWEKRGRPELAFPYYRRANEFKQQVYRQANVAFDRGKHRALIDGLIEVFTPQYIERIREFGINNEEPVFVVGMVRSGTSLVEQILASHRAVHGAGERKDIDDLAINLHRQLGVAAPYPACLPQLEAGLARSLAYGYLQRLARQAGTARRIVDKMPHNFLHLGLIAVLFPRCRIIHCRRDPMDVCVSAYLQNFKWLPHAASLEHIAFYHQEYTRLMDHWRRVLPVPIHEVVYEDLVANPQAVSRALVAACGLEWNDRCLSFHRTERVVQTASKLQVRQPIYHRSVGRWKAFAAHLEPLRLALGIAPYHHRNETQTGKLEECHA